MSKVSKSFKFSLAANEIIKVLQEHTKKNGNNFNQTEIVEQALFHYLVAVKGEKELSRIILESVK